MPSFVAQSAALMQWLPTAVAVGGILIGLIIHRQKLRQDRELALKKDTLLALADSFAEAMVAVGGLVFAPDITAATTAMTKFAGVIGKIHCTASEGTLRRVLDVQKEVTRFHQFSVARHLQLKEIAGSIEVASETLTAQQNALEQLNGGSSDPAFISQLLGARGVLVVQIAETNKVLAAAQAERDKFIPQVQAELREFLAAVAKAQQEVTVLVRRELGNRLDEKWYRNAMEEMMGLALAPLPSKP